ncbi:hypothetical protein [Fimbriiglobus ruber]|uniref:Uncharacterized protein n=1 Tax=Fimbriiglobus ruber TaxID=1908690 RepID=A0A225DFL6_9BACT|nr:hypothetical protein [Fimbriiglobus ruber]OWK34877.1 hypothetical protein FRUB_09719 [Fimbriiglobus ruber]
MLPITAVLAAASLALSPGIKPAARVIVIEPVQESLGAVPRLKIVVSYDFDSSVGFKYKTSGKTLGTEMDVPVGAVNTPYSLPGKEPVGACVGGTLQVNNDMLTMVDVVLMSQQGLSDEKIINQIRATRAVFQPSVRDLVTLKDRRVSDAVINEVVTSRMRAASTQPPPVVVPGLGFSGYYRYRGW